MVSELDAALSHFAEVVRRQLGPDVSGIPGAGAAGGLGAGLIAFLDAELKPGSISVLEIVGLEEHLDGADLVITGEGCLDRQTLYNKAPIGVAASAKVRDIPVIAISGSLGEGYIGVHDRGIHAAAAITSAPMTLEEASDRAYELAASATEQAVRFMVVGGRVFGGG